MKECYRIVVSTIYEGENRSVIDLFSSDHHLIYVWSEGLPECVNQIK